MTPSRKPMRTAPLGERIAQDMRVAIVRGEYSPGARIVEEELAEKYEVSRGPVRDALKTLSGEHLVTPERRGYLVRGVGPDDVDELYDVRGALESLAVASVVRHAADIDWTTTERELDAMLAAADAGDWYAYAAHDLAYHSTFYKLAPNRRLESMWDGIEPTFGVILEQTNRQDVDLHPSHADHVRLLTSIREGRTDDALEYLEEHLDGSRTRMKASLARMRR